MPADNEFQWGTLKQWLGWIVFCGIVPSVACLLLARHMRQQQLAYCATTVPMLLLYFFILAALRLDVPGKVAETPRDDSSESRRSLRVLAGYVVDWAKALVILVACPVLGAYLLHYAVSDGETVFYFFGPAVIWVSGGTWALAGRLVRNERARRRQA